MAGESAETIDANGTNDTPLASELLTVELQGTEEAFKNPLKGFRPTRFMSESEFKPHEYGTLYKHYIPYTELEAVASDSVQQIIDWSNLAWKDIEQKNIKVVPRVIIRYPEVGDYWPDGIPHGDPFTEWTTEELKDRLVSFIAKLGEAWNNDPRVAFIESSLWGDWGEHHIHPIKLADGTSFIPKDFQKAIGDAYVKAFPNKKVTIRYPYTFIDYDFGFYWDSFAHADDHSSGNGIIERDDWRTQVISGEVAYNWGNYREQPGGSPDESLSIKKHRDHIIDWIRETHTSGLGWIDMYKNPLNREVAAGATEMQQAFGYRYVIHEASFTDSVEPGGTLQVNFDVVNEGSAPFYYDWPVEASLLDENRKVVWKGEFVADIRAWLPGEDWDTEARKYSKPALVNKVTGDFKLPSELAKGDYTLALAILDPAGGEPSIKFAVANYYTGGRHPVGKVGIGQKPQDQDLGPFDSLKFDSTLSYALNQ
ncbi:DUF4832 domain-containing protein [Paenibacillus mendelii]|uniref:DUF4832 domain-containing protein n=1 Tax=Paenibacillus mendelii TaxID=206163 RepID=A0ABV6JDZ9_9BACL|nr:DUF4832 domain-containing protein [Paenibacillus mendelii]MCQ6563461.1 DUF4832 domain-containing protein [Paenibacillus mendelii]